MPDSGLNVVQVQYGERVTRKSVVLHDYQQYDQPDGDLQMDYNFWVIRSADAIILLDTGYDIGARDWLGEIASVLGIHAVTSAAPILAELAGELGGGLAGGGVGDGS